MSAERRLTGIRLPLVTLTPLFLGGADPRGDPELRAASVRGALRFWLRALLGGCYGTDQAALREIRRLEAETFGEAGGEGKLGASKVIVRVRVEASPRSGQGPVTTVIPWQASRDSGRGYLFFSMDSTRVRGQEFPARSYYPPPLPFVVELSPRPGVDERAARDALYRTVRAAWLLLHLGGIGARSRRLGGALAHQPMSRRTPDGQVVATVPSYLNLPFALPPVPAEAAKRLGDGLTDLRGRLRARPDANPERPAWEVLDPRWCRIWVFGERDWTSSESGWQAAAETIGSWLRETRRAFSTEQRLVFGAPLVIPQRRESVTPPTPYERVDRRPSPLWLTVTRAENGQLLGVATLFATHLFPRRQGSDERLEPLYDRIAQELAKLPNVAEVSYE
ncbi:MAG: type III-B CRISPR module RAMP protein Cmr1 [Thermomicrobium sp.]|nr:type III-B CRISPR module RAMP protein Cmr1 [Thermomicrobium sp.]